VLTQAAGKVNKEFDQLFSGKVGAKEVSQGGRDKAVATFKGSLGGAPETPGIAW